MSSLAADIRFALRSWAKTPILTLIVVASIGLGIGANTAIFTLVDQVLLRKLPVEDPRALVQVTAEGESYGSSRGDGTEISYPMYAALRDHNAVFSGIFAVVAFALQVGESGQPERVSGELVSGSYFPVLGVRPAQGRLLGEEDDRVPGGHPVVVLSHAFWTSRFAASPSAVGRTLVVNGRSYTIVGVAQSSFEGLELGRQAQVFLPITMKAHLTPGWNGLEDRLNRWVRVFGRLRPGTTREQARVALEPLFRGQLRLDLDDTRMASAAPVDRQRHAENRLVLLAGEQGRSRFRSALATPLWVLMGTASGLLLIACANVANLLLARGAGRGREIAVRLALGATRGRVAQQLLVESVLLAGAGALAGLALSAFAAPLVLALFVSPDMPVPVSAAPDLRVFAFTMALATLTGVLFGLAPALHATRDVAPVLKAQAGGVLGGGSARLRKVLVASQVGISLLMLIGAGLFLRTLDNLRAVDVGFHTRTLVSFSVDPSLNGYTPASSKQFALQLLERLRATPGVSAASLSYIKLLDGNRWSADIGIEGRPPGTDEDRTQLCNAVGPGFFRTLGIPVLRGREFDQRDTGTAGDDENGIPPFRVAVANERFVKEYFGDQDPIGRRIGFGADPGRPTPIEIVGVVADSAYTDVRDDIQRQLFFPYLQAGNPGQFTVYVATTQPPAAAFAAARTVVGQLDPNLPLALPRTLEQQVARSLSRERLVATMSAVFGVLATLLSVVGLYGVMAYTVTRRTREIGVRVALGADARDIRWMVIREALTVAAAGMAVAAPLAWWSSRLVASQLYGVSAGDPATAFAAVGLLGAVSFFAALVPSARAARVEPTRALRYE